MSLLSTAAPLKMRNNNINCGLTAFGVLMDDVGDSPLEGARLAKSTKVHCSYFVTAKTEFLLQVKKL
jgi:hypothetical protein